MADAAPLQIHATAVALLGTGVLLRGPPGSGKSDLALRLIDGGAKLVADDRVELTREAGHVVARAPASLSGLIEIRGIGILKLPSDPATRLSLVVDLVSGDVDRLPSTLSERVLGLDLRKIRLASFEASAPAKLRALIAWPAVLPDQTLGDLTKI